MALWICRDCTAAYSVDAPACPQCGSADRVDEKEQNMPKITVAGGPSVAGITAAWGSEEPTENTEGSEQTSPGTSSSTSSQKPSTSPETSSSETPSPARTTASRSRKARTGSSAAPSTAIDPTAPTSGTDSDEGGEK